MARQWSTLTLVVYSISAMTIRNCTNLPFLFQH